MQSMPPHTHSADLGCLSRETPFSVASGGSPGWQNWVRAKPSWCLRSRGHSLAVFVQRSCHDRALWVRVNILVAEPSRSACLSEGPPTSGPVHGTRDADHSKAFVESLPVGRSVLLESGEQIVHLRSVVLIGHEGRTGSEGAVGAAP